MRRIFDNIISLAVVVIVLFLVVQMISEFFDTVKTLFQF